MGVWGGVYVVKQWDCLVVSRRVLVWYSFFLDWLSLCGYVWGGCMCVLDVYVLGGLNNGTAWLYQGWL